MLLRFRTLTFVGSVRLPSFYEAFFWYLTFPITLCGLSRTSRSTVFSNR